MCRFLFMASAVVVGCDARPLTGGPEPISQEPAVFCNTGVNGNGSEGYRADGRQLWLERNSARIDWIYLPDNWRLDREVRQTTFGELVTTYEWFGDRNEFTRETPDNTWVGEEFFTPDGKLTERRPDPENYGEWFLSIGYDSLGRVIHRSESNRDGKDYAANSYDYTWDGDGNTNTFTYTMEEYGGATVLHGSEVYTPDFRPLRSESEDLSLLEVWEYVADDFRVSAKMDGGRRKEFTWVECP